MSHIKSISSWCAFGSGTLIICTSFVSFGLKRKSVGIETCKDQLWQKVLLQRTQSSKDPIVWKPKTTNGYLFALKYNKKVILPLRSCVSASNKNTDGMLHAFYSFSFWELWAWDVLQCHHIMISCSASRTGPEFAASRGCFLVLMDCSSHD